MNRKQAQQYLDSHQVEAKISAHLKEGATVYSIMVDPQDLPASSPDKSDGKWGVLIHGTNRQENVETLMQASPWVPLGCVRFIGSPVRVDAWPANACRGNHALGSFLYEAGRHAMKTDTELRPMLDYWMTQAGIGVRNPPTQRTP